MSRVEQAAQGFAALETRLLLAVRTAESLTLTRARYELEQASRGTYTPRQLRQMDHPYARRHGQALRDPAILNQRSGLLARSWRVLSVRAIRRGPRRGTRGSVINRSSSAGWIASGGKGSSKMVQRPIIERVERRISGPRQERIQNAIRSVLRDF